MVGGQGDTSTSRSDVPSVGEWWSGMSDGEGPGSSDVPTGGEGREAGG